MLARTTISTATSSSYRRPSVRGHERPANDGGAYSAVWITGIGWGGEPSAARQYTGRYGVQPCAMTVKWFVKMSTPITMRSAPDASLDLVIVAGIFANAAKKRLMAARGEERQARRANTRTAAGRRCPRILCGCNRTGFRRGLVQCTASTRRRTQCRRASRREIRPDVVSSEPASPDTATRCAGRPSYAVRTR